MKYYVAVRHTATDQCVNPIVYWKEVPNIQYTDFSTDHSDVMNQRDPRVHNNIQQYYNLEIKLVFGMISCFVGTSQLTI